MNKVIIGDCKVEMSKMEEKIFDLIYLDPPFFTQTVQKLKDKDDVEYQFCDKWANIDAYCDFIKGRLIECRRVLKETGSIFLHCDKKASHYLKVVMDEIFGEGNFQSEIIWYYKRWSNSKKGLLNSHQTIFFYSKSTDFKFNQQYENYSLSTNLDQIFQERERGENGKSKYKFNSNGSVKLLDSKKGVPLGDVWDIPYLNPKAKERCGYPTQKPIVLLERIIGLCTEPGDSVLDPFCGSGTTLVASKLLNRKYIGIDQSIEATNLCNQRLETPTKTLSKLLIKGRDSYENLDDKTNQILKKINAYPVQRNKGIDGFFKLQDSIQPIPIRVVRDNETEQEASLLLFNSCKSQNFKKMILISLNPSYDKNTLFDFNPTSYYKDLIVINTLEELEIIAF